VTQEEAGKTFEWMEKKEVRFGGFSVICTAFVHAEGRRKMRKFLNRAKNTEKISVIKN